MAPRKSESGASSWLEVGSGGDGGGESNEAAIVAVSTESEERRQEPAEAGSEEAPPEENPLKEEAAVADPSIFQLPYPRPRMRWTVELHDQFVKAVDELGGANRATPKLIHALMGVEGITLFHLKSHLQKYRLGKTGRRLWRKDLLPPNYFERRDMVPPVNQQQADEPSVQSAFNMNGDEALSDLHLMVEPQTAPPRPPTGTELPPSLGPLTALGPLPALPAPPAPAPAMNSVKYEDVVGPPLLPLFPASGPTMEWPEFNQGGARRALENPPTMDDYLNYSADFTNPSFNTFFDDVATLPTPNPDFFTAPPTFP